MKKIFTLTKGILLLSIIVPFFSYGSVDSSSNDSLLEIYKNQPLLQSLKDSTNWFTQENPSNEEEIQEWKLVGYKFPTCNAFFLVCWNSYERTKVINLSYLPESHSPRSPPLNS